MFKKVAKVAKLWKAKKNPDSGKEIQENQPQIVNVPVHIR